MKLTETGFQDLYLLEPRKFEDSRGYFFESFNEKAFNSLVSKEYKFVQDNQSHSKYGVMRGLHFQTGDFAQAKLVRVLRGSVLDVVVDVRPQSKTFGKSFSAELTEHNQMQMIVPRGFAHGFVVLSDFADFFYKCDNYYSPSHDSGILFSDPALKIDWKINHSKLIVSEKDQKLQTLNNLKVN